jgi:peptide/nickel transport system ATP-binding protein
MMLEAQGLTRTFGGGRTLLGRPRRAVHAVRGVDLEVRRGETLGIVGESGCGKSTLARMLVGLDVPTAGRIRLDGRDVGESVRRDRRALARSIQYVFQDPVSSLNPRKTIRTILEKPMIHLLGMDRARRGRRLEELMDAVNLRAEFLDRYPHEFSGGQAQRIGIARALAAEARVMVLDEPVSALDVSVQAQVLNILDGLKSRFDLTYVFISHDLSVVESVSDRVAVMYFGRIVETGAAANLFRAPRHPYTRLLFDSAPVPGRRSVRGEAATAELPDPLSPPPGCAFAPRCPRAQDRCRRSTPPLSPLTDEADTVRRHGDRAAACYYPLDHEPGD